MFSSLWDLLAAASRRPVERAICVRGDRELLFWRGVGSWRRKSQRAGREVAAERSRP